MKKFIKKQFNYYHEKSKATCDKDKLDKIDLSKSNLSNQNLNNSNKNQIVHYDSNRMLDINSNIINSNGNSKMELFNNVSNVNDILNNMKDNLF